MVAGEQLKPHLVSLMTLLSQCLEDRNNPLVSYYAVLTMTELVFMAGDDEGKYFQAVVPKVLSVIQFLIQHDEELACEVFEFLDEMLDCDIAVLSLHVKTVVEFCMQVGANSDLGDPVRVRALSFVGSLVRTKKKTFLKHKLVIPVLHVLFPVMCACEDDDDETELNESETHTPSAYAGQVIDTMALHLPPERVIPHVMVLVEPALSHQKWQHRKAAYLAMAVITEGCADYIATKHLNDVLQCVYKGLNDSDHRVKNAALFTLGQFSEYLQPQISKYASEILPLIYGNISQAVQEEATNPTGIGKCYYALEMFCENLGKRILPYLPTLMDHLLSVLRSNVKPSMRELAISAIGAAANAAKEGMQPYFLQVLAELKVFLSKPETEDMLKLQVQAIDTLAVLARTVGASAFLPLSRECVQMGLNLIENVNDPDLRRCVYGLFAALSTLLKADVAEFLPQMVHLMTESIMSVEGVQAHLADEKKKIDNLLNDTEVSDSEDIAEESEEEEEDLKGVSVENAYLDEKEDACSSLGELAANAGPAFMPYMEKSFAQLLRMLSYPASNVRKGAVMGVGSLCTCLANEYHQTKSEETGTALKTMTSTVIPKLLEIIETEPERIVVMTAFETLEEIIDKAKLVCLEVEGTVEAILTVIKKIFSHKTSCQDGDEGDDADQEAEYDGMLIECAGDILPAMARVMGGQNFLPILSNFLPDLLRKLRETSSVPERSFAIGTLAETVEACGSASSSLVDVLYPVFMKGLRDEDEEVRSNAAYAVGILVSNGGHNLHPHYPEVLKTLFDVLGKESNGRVIDNICAAACRLVSVNSGAVPLDQVIPVIVQCLPLKEDYDEQATVFRCLTQMYTSGNQQLIQYVPQLLKVVSQVLGTIEVNEESEEVLAEFVRAVEKQFPAEVQSLKAGLSQENRAKLEAATKMS
ncbi:importin-4-like isoform X2 [Liolophura sinensis]